MTDGTWLLRNTDRGTERECDSRAEAEDAKQDLAGLGADPGDLELVPPGDDDPEVIDVDSDGHDLPDEPPGIDTDPLEWVPGDFIDHIEGTPVINKKGFSVLCQHFDIEVQVDILISPTDTDFEYAQCKGVAITRGGTRYEAFGSAHTDRGDEKELLLEMADTRAFKRAASRATGVGIIAVEEIKAGGEV